MIAQFYMSLIWQEAAGNHNFLSAKHIKVFVSDCFCIFAKRSALTHTPVCECLRTLSPVCQHAEG